MPVGLRFMTWNISYGKFDGHLRTVATLIRGTGVDAAILQEIAISGPLAGGVNQVDQLAADTGLGNRVFVKDGVYGGGDVGNAVLSRFPLGPVQTITYGPTRIIGGMTGAPTLLRVTASIHRLTHHIFSAHPRHDDDIRACARLVRDQVQGLPGGDAVLFGADMNWGRGTGSPISDLTAVLQDSFGRCPDTSPSFCAQREGGDVDYAMYRGPYQLQSTESRCPGDSLDATQTAFPSDHAWVLATVKDLRPEDAQCEQLRVGSRDRLLRAIEMQQEKEGLDPRNPADRREITRINNEITRLRSEASGLRQQADQLACLSSDWFPDAPPC